MNISAKRAKKLLSFRRLEEIGSRGWGLGSRREIGALNALSSYLIFPSPEQPGKARLLRQRRTSPVGEVFRHPRPLGEGQGEGGFLTAEDAENTEAKSINRWVSTHPTNSTQGLGAG